MVFVRSFVVVRAECQMKLLFSDVVLLRVSRQPGQFHLKGVILVSDEDDDERTIVCHLAPLFFQSEGFFIKSKGCIEIRNVVVFVNHSEFHFVLSPYKSLAAMYP